MPNLYQTNFAAHLSIARLIEDENSNGIHSFKCAVDTLYFSSKRFDDNGNIEIFIESICGHAFMRFQCIIHFKRHGSLVNSDIDDYPIRIKNFCWSD